ncbi:CdaR family transcriptional regulator [Anaerobium acetethylicum]|uniref:Carbohydrate diacid regulator n=1 Tax=Anaerobium acetethylicum TaxID=1619234 RepID=A0A1D3TPV9_9FIRM|nr:sugar diacid recognition domain-containing protein [Anaerobium acetethylicum]SCP95557.1 carbohydrate diacid regulator [Anaerobium acetethylicum]
MIISKNLAQSIVDNIKEIIHHEINFIETDGTIIASTDENRIGKIHEGAKKVIATGQDLIIRFDDEFPGTRSGFNTAVYFQNQIIGIIGITGVPEVVIQYAKIIRKLTELMITEAHAKSSDFMRRQNEKAFIDSLIYNDYLSDSDTLSAAHYNIKLPRRCIVGVISNESDVDYDVYHTLRRYLSDSENTVISAGSSVFVVFSTITSKGTLAFHLNEISQHIKHYHQMDVSFGIGRICTSFEESKMSYKQACQSLKWAQNFSKEIIQFYSEMDIGLLLVDFSEPNSKSLQLNTLSNLTGDEIKEYIEILRVYEANNGSISRSAEDLFIHKNTLQYRLNKLHEKTGFNPRELKDFTILKLAFMSYEMHPQI